MSMSTSGPSKQGFQIIDIDEDSNKPFMGKLTGVHYVHLKVNGKEFAAYKAQDWDKLQNNRTGLGTITGGLWKLWDKICSNTNIITKVQVENDTFVVINKSFAKAHDKRNVNSSEILKTFAEYATSNRAKPVSLPAMTPAERSQVTDAVKASAEQALLAEVDEAAAAASSASSQKTQASPLPHHRTIGMNDVFGERLTDALRSQDIQDTIDDLKQPEELVSLDDDRFDDDRHVFAVVHAMAFAQNTKNTENNKTMDKLMNGIKKLSPEVRQNLAEAANNHDFQERIAQEFGISRKTLQEVRDMLQKLSQTAADAARSPTSQSSQMSSSKSPSAQTSAMGTQSRPSREMSQNAATTASSQRGTSPQKPPAQPTSAPAVATGKSKKPANRSADQAARSNPQQEPKVAPQESGRPSRNAKHDLNPKKK